MDAAGGRAVYHIAGAAYGGDAAVGRMAGALTRGLWARGIV